jgi:hypothetical protein
LRLFAIGWFLQRHNPCAARVEVLHEPLNGAALAGGVTTLEHDDVPRAGAPAVFLQLQQLNLQPPFQPVVFVAGYPVVIWVSLAPRLDIIAIPIKQHRIVVILIVDRVPVFGRRKGFQIYFRHKSALT